RSSKVRPRTVGLMIANKVEYKIVSRVTDLELRGRVREYFGQRRVGCSFESIYRSLGVPANFDGEHTGQAARLLQRFHRRRDLFVVDEGLGQLATGTGRK